MRYEVMILTFEEAARNSAVTYVNGQFQEEIRKVDDALAQASADGWDLTHAFSHSPGWATLVFKRPAAA